MGELNDAVTPRVLVIIDDEEHRAVVRRIFKDEGFAVTSVEGRTGLHLLQVKGPFHLLVADLHLNEIDPRLLLNLANERSMPTMLVAHGYAEFEAREACLLGASSIWALPVDRDYFLARASELIERHRPVIDAAEDQTVLIIEDNEATRRVMKRTLIDAGYRVLEAEDGQQGIILASSNDIHMVVLDINMPRMNGLAVCEVLKTQKSTAHIPVLICTVRSGSEDQVRAIAAAADDFLTKPFRPDELIRRVAKFVKSANYANSAN